MCIVYIHLAPLVNASIFRPQAELLRRCFGWFASFFFDHGEMAYVYEHEGAILGGITISSFRIDDTKRGGIVKWVFTAPEARGHGAASQLIDRAMKWFAEHECTHVFACVEGYNTGSSNRFAGLGFRILSFTEQLRSFGLRLPVVWLKTFHVVDIGHFLWTHVQGEVASETDSPTRGTRGGAQVGAFAGTVLAHTVFMYLLLLRRGAAAPGVEHLWAVPAALGLLFGLRFGAMWTTAAAMKLLPGECCFVGCPVPE